MCTQASDRRLGGKYTVPDETKSGLFEPSSGPGELFWSEPAHPRDDERVSFACERGDGALTWAEREAEEYQYWYAEGFPDGVRPDSPISARTTFPADDATDSETFDRLWRYQHGHWVEGRPAPLDNDWLDDERRNQRDKCLRADCVASAIGWPRWLRDIVIARVRSIDGRKWSWVGGIPAAVIAEGVRALHERGIVPFEKVTSSGWWPAIRRLSDDIGVDPEGAIDYADISTNGGDCGDFDG